VKEVIACHKVETKDVKTKSTSDVSKISAKPQDKRKLFEIFAFASYVNRAVLVHYWQAASNAQIASCGSQLFSFRCKGSFGQK